MGFRTITRINIKRTKLSTRPLMMLISKDMKAVIQSRFRNSIGPDGSHWAGVNNRTGKPLLITGSLMRSFKNSYTSNTAIVGTNDIRARLHQFGGTIKAKNKSYLHFKIGDKWVKVKEVKIKARSFNGFNQELFERYKTMVTSYLSQELKESLGGK